MQALVYQGPGRKSVQEHPRPGLQGPGDAIVRMTRTTICGTDLHILKGNLPDCRPGTVLGHEGVGIVEAVGAGVSAFERGDRVLISCITACARCAACRLGMPSHCATGGWLLGNTIDGTQAEFVRIPHADTSLFPVPDGVDEAALILLSGILPSGFACGALNGKVKPGGSVAIVGAGPVGLAALLGAQVYAPAMIVVVDVDAQRLGVAQQFGATATVNGAAGRAAEQVLKLTGGRGVDSVIEAAGIPAAIGFCRDIVAAGGTIADLGGHGRKVDLQLERLWSHGPPNTTGLADPALLQMPPLGLRPERSHAARLITHRPGFDGLLEAYDTFADAAESHALKVIVEV